MAIRSVSFPPLQCVSVSIPENEDVHMLFLAIPSAAVEEDDHWIEKHDSLEEYFIAQMVDLTKHRVNNALPTKFLQKPPKEIQKLVSQFVDEYGDIKTGAKVKLSNPTSQASKTLETYWFTPVVMNYVKGEDETALEGYSICFDNDNEWPILMILESVITSDPVGDSEDGVPGLESAHLTPFVEQLTESIKSARSIVKEMNLMERRESKMRISGDKINGRVKVFSYISVAVLVVVSYLQVTYLKQYFHKKKLL